MSGVSVDKTLVPLGGLKPFFLATKILDAIEQKVVPLTEVGVANGNKLFGAAILRKSNGSVVVPGSNEEVDNPMWHGETVCIRKFYTLKPEDRPQDVKECIFVATHEPCSLCLSAITWCGFDNFVYLFDYQDSRDKHNIPHDLNILKEVFRLENGGYNKANGYWTAFSVKDVIDLCDPDERGGLLDRVEKLRAKYDELSAVYQENRTRVATPLK